jgi:beta-glucosidase
MLLSHGLVIPVIHRNSPGSEVGITLNLNTITPASPSKADHDAAREYDGLLNRWFLEPLYGRQYPADMVEVYEKRGWLPNGLDFVQSGDWDVISTPADFLGLNTYTRTVVRSDAIPESENAPRTVFTAPQSEWTEMGWEISHEALFDLLCRLHFEYQPGKIYITENGASYSDGPDVDGRIHDHRRIAYYKGQLASVQRAIQCGVPVAGYFAWSLMDNFEWGRGYTQRFGLIWVDYKTLERKLKDSAYWYREVVEHNWLEG